MTKQRWGPRGRAIRDRQTTVRGMGRCKMTKQRLGPRTLGHGGQVGEGGRGVGGRGADLQPGAPHLIDDRKDSEGQADAFLATVLHQLKLPIRRHKADYLLSVEAPQIHTLVKCHVLHTPSIVIFSEAM